MLRGAWLVLIATGCKSSPVNPDAPVPDAAPDAGDVCGATELFLTGEYLDWDSTAASFLGVFDASFTARAVAHSDQTSPNGRFELCVPADPEQLVDIVPKLTAEPYLGGTLVVLKDAVAAGGTFSLRTFTKTRGQAAPFAFDPGRAQVFVHVIGQPRAAEVSAPHQPGFHFTGAAWAAGAMGQDIYVPNVDPAGGATKLTIANASAVSTIPIAANTFTFVVVASH